MVRTVHFAVNERTLVDVHKRFEVIYLIHLIILETDLIMVDGWMGVQIGNETDIYSKWANGCMNSWNRCYWAWPARGYTTKVPLGETGSLGVQLKN